MIEVDRQFRYKQDMYKIHACRHTYMQAVMLETLQAAGASKRETYDVNHADATFTGTVDCLGVLSVSVCPVYIA
jgi:hypothetical protein